MEPSVSTDIRGDLHPSTGPIGPKAHRGTQYWNSNQGHGKVNAKNVLRWKISAVDLAVLYKISFYIPF